MKVLHVVTSIFAEAQGPAYTVPNLCESLAKQGTNIELHTLNPLPEKLPIGVKTVGYTAWQFPKKLGVSNKMYRELLNSNAQIIHNHLLWLMPNYYTGRAATRKRKVLVTSPRGTLSQRALSHSRFKKKVMWLLGQQDAIKYAECIHVTAESELQDVRDFGITQPIVLLPNGIDIPKYIASAIKRDKRKLVYLGRIHSIKGIENLIEAWSLISGRFPDWELEIYGPGEEKYINQLKLLAEKRKAKQISFLGPVYGEQKNHTYRDADLYVLPSYSENFAMTVAEALSYGVPVITTKGTPWQGVEEQGCGWWIDTGVEPLEACLNEALGLSRHRLQQMGQQGRNWIEAEFSWERIGEQMQLTYQWLLEGGTQPACVRLA